MLLYIFSIVIIVVSNIFYNICQKSTPQDANPFAALFITYSTSTILSATVAIPFFSINDGIFPSFHELNWTSFVLGIAIVGLELGYLMAYRAGWNISVGSLVANIVLALILIPIGVWFYHEGFDLLKVLGFILCLGGLILINKKSVDDKEV